ncbi:MAG: hypothetical protein RIQ93_1736 [Verrucomicrobiota bacterium]|jgi:endonuclease/exonuclease/phosphatase family metal-dependent hydrolase
MVVAYNVENLVDLDGNTAFEDYQPARYSRAHALTKLQNIARVVARFEGGRGPDVLLLSELEVDFTPAESPLDYAAFLAEYQGVTLEMMLGVKFDRRVGDLPAEALLLKALSEVGITGYHVVVAENATAAGTARKLEHKCAVFTRFPVRSSRSHPTLDARAILEVQVEVDGAPLFLFSNHWKSGASDPATEKTRMANARTLRQRVDEILREEPNADIIIGGDLNSQYNQKQRYPAMKQTGLNDVLGSQGNELAVRGQRPLYNLWYELPLVQRGSDTFRGEWGTLMHLIITRGLYDFRGVQYVDNSFAVGKFTGLNADAKGLPVRWSFDGPAGSGFSDHFPVFAKFITVPDGRTDRYLALRNASVEQPGPAVSTRIDYARMDVDKLALTPAQLPPDGNIRANDYKGKLFRVEGRVAPGNRLAVEFLGDTYDVWSYDEALRAKLRANYAAGAPIKFFAELGVYRERWQFVIQDPSWVR